MSLADQKLETMPAGQPVSALGVDSAGLPVLFDPWQFVTPRDFGALAAGADETSAVQAAIDNADGLPVAFLKGDVFRCTTTLVYPSGTRLFGDGSGAGISFTGGVYLGFVNADTTNGNDDVSFENFTVDFGYPTRTGELSHGIRILAADNKISKNFRLCDMTLKNVPGAALQAMNVQDAVISGNRIDNTSRDGVTVWFNSRQVVIADNVMRDVGDDCIALNSEDPGGGHNGAYIVGATVSGNVLSQRSDSVYGTGIRCAGARQVSIAGNEIGFAQGEGILVEDGISTSIKAADVSVSGNAVKTTGNTTSGASGISVSGTTERVVIDGNTVDDYWANGIYLNSAGVVCVSNAVGVGRSGTSLGILVAVAGCIVSSNRVLGAQSAGIQINAGNAVVSANQVRDCAQVVTGSSYITLAAGVNGCAVTGNVCHQVAVGGTFAIRIATGSGGYNTIVGNVAKGWSGSGISDGSSSGTNVVANNAQAA